MKKSTWKDDWDSNAWWISALTFWNYSVKVLCRYISSCVLSAFKIAPKMLPKMLQKCFLSAPNMHMKCSLKPYPPSTFFFPSCNMGCKPVFTSNLGTGLRPFFLLVKKVFLICVPCINKSLTSKFIISSLHFESILCHFKKARNYKKKQWARE